MLSHLRSIFHRRTWIKSLSDIGLSSHGAQTLHPPHQSGYATFDNPPPVTRHRPCISQWWAFAALGVLLSIQSAHQLYALIHPTSLQFHNFYRYHSATDIPRFRAYITVNILIILTLDLCGAMVISGVLRQGSRLEKKAQYCWLFLASGWLVVPFFLFIATLASSQPEPVIRVMMARRCGETALTVGQVSESIALKKLWLTGRNGEEVTLSGWGWRDSTTKHHGFRLWKSMVKIGDETGWTTEADRVLNVEIEFTPAPLELMDDDPIVANYVVNITLSPSAPQPSPISRDRLITWHQSATIEDPRALFPPRSNHPQFFPLLSPPIVVRVNEEGTRDLYSEMEESRVVQLVRKVENEREYAKWCVRWNMKEMMENPEKLGTVAVVAGWIAGESHVL